MNQTTETFKDIGLWLLALFLSAVGAQLWVVWLYGSPIPVWDQWYEAGRLFKPWREGHLIWTDLVGGHNEHRMLMTRLLDLGLIRLNGRWEPLLQMTVNAFIRASFACGLAFCLWNFLGRKAGWLICCVLTPFFTLPYAGENAIWGINSLYYFTDIFALVALAGLGFGNAGTWQWQLGFLAAILGLFTTASGLLAPLAAGGLIVLRALKNRRMERENLITLSVCVLVVALGAALSVRVEQDAPLMAHSFREFAGALTRNLAWPFFNAPVIPCLICLPLVLLLVVYLRPNFQTSRTAEFLLCLALWSVLQSILIAYGRANYGGSVPVSRYADFFNFFVIASVFAVMLLVPLGGRFHGGVLAFIFIAVIFFGLCKISQIVVEDLLVPTRMMNLVAEERVRTFVARGNEQDLLERPTVQPDPKVTLEVLRDPKLQTILPGICRASAASSGSLTSASDWLLQYSIEILSAGLILFAALCGVRLVRMLAGLNAGNQTAAAIIVLLAGLVALGFVWSKRFVSRQSVERQLDAKIVANFQTPGNFKRAAAYQQTMSTLPPFAN